MIIGNNNFNDNSNFENQVRTTSTQNNFENKWKQIKEYNEHIQPKKNIFVKDIKEQKYANAKDTTGMQDKTLAMLHERLENNLISLEEFNQKCAQLGEQRQNMNKKNNLF